MGSDSLSTFARDEFTKATELTRRYSISYLLALLYKNREDLIPLGAGIWKIFNQTIDSSQRVKSISTSTSTNTNSGNRRTFFRMVKFKLSSLLPGSNAGTTEAKDVKQANRRSFSGLMTKPKGDETKQSIAEAETVMDPPSKMTQLASKISQETAKLEAYFKENNLPLPSFDVDADLDYHHKLPAHIKLARQEIIYATKELRDLTVGPRESVRWSTWEHLDVLALQTLNHFNIAKLFPIDSTITLGELQAKSRLDSVNLARLVRYAMTNNIFREVSPGVIAHTAASRCIAEDDDLQAWIGFNTEDIFPASAHVLQALEIYPQAVELTQTGFNFAFDTVEKEPMFVTFGKDPARAKRMGRAMASLTGGEGYEVRYISEGYDFSAIDAKEGVFVDVGGSHGFVCVDLARRYKNMRFVVQDLPKTVDSAPKPICEDPQVAARVELMAHDFFTEQPVKGADVYFFRWIMHNYSTPYAIKLLRNLVPALKPGAKVLINDHCLSEPGQENPWDEKLMRGMDLVMLALLNAQERTEEEFRELFTAADEGFVFKGVIRPAGSRMSIIEAVWKPDEVEGAAADKVTASEPINEEVMEQAPLEKPTEPKVEA